MRNITPTVDEKVLAAVRHYATSRDRSVNALVKEFLTELATRHGRAAKARAEIRRLSRTSPARLGARTWTRGELHER